MAPLPPTTRKQQSLKGALKPASAAVKRREGSAPPRVLAGHQDHLNRTVRFGAAAPSPLVVGVAQRSVSAPPRLITLEEDQELLKCIVALRTAVEDGGKLGDTYTRGFLQELPQKIDKTITRLERTSSQSDTLADLKRERRLMLLYYEASDRIRDRLEVSSPPNPAAMTFTDGEIELIKRQEGRKVLDGFVRLKRAVMSETDVDLRHWPLQALDSLKKRTTEWCGEYTKTSTAESAATAEAMQKLRGYVDALYGLPRVQKRRKQFEIRDNLDYTTMASDTWPKLSQQRDRQARSRGLLVYDSLKFLNDELRNANSQYDFGPRIEQLEQSLNGMVPTKEEHRKSQAFMQTLLASIKAKALRRTASTNTSEARVTGDARSSRE